MHVVDERKIQLLLDEMEQLKIELWKEEGKLKFRDYNGNLTPALKERLKVEKENILAYFDLVENAEKLPLTSLQYAYLLGEKEGYELGGCTAHYYLEYEAEHVDQKRLEEALNRSILENDALRMKIMPSGYQYVQSQVRRIEIEEFEGEEEWKRIRQERTTFGYKPGQWPMFHFMLTHLEDKDILHIDFDCMVLDASSARIMIQNVLRDYNGEEVSYPKFGFADYLKINAAKPVDEKAHDYWMKRCKTMPKAPNLPYKKPFSQVENIRFQRLEHYFTEEETTRLYETAKKNHVSLAAVICTCFAKTLYEQGGNTPLTLNLTLFSREMVHEEANDILGEFTNIGFVSMEEEKESFSKQVQNVQLQFWKLLQYRSYDGTKVLKELSRGRSTEAIMPVVFTCVLGEEGENEEIDGFKEVYSLSRTPQVSLDHHVRENKGKVKISWDYIEELFDEKELRGIFDAYVNQIKQVML
ncbi:MAG: hypothetical protein IJV50_10955 [Lachnospiraceae bacterium]|nr:hypothetical protein [Lachnospiraceae bacterium]